MADAITIHEEQLDDQPVVWREAPGADVLYLHGAPSSSRDWEPFLARTGGVAPDMIGFGRSGKRADRDYSMHGLAAFVERFVDMLGLDTVTLVVHDWGAAGLLWAMREPRRIERLVIINAVPLFSTYRWHRVARVWRAPLLGELAMGATGRRMLRRSMLDAKDTPLPTAMVDAISDDLDVGTQRALLRLYRSAGSDALGRAGLGLSDITCPALVVWGDRDPYIPSTFAQSYADALGGPTEIAHFADAGHWPWLQSPRVVDVVVGHMG